MARPLKEIEADIALVRADTKAIQQVLADAGRERDDLFTAMNRLVKEFNAALAQLYPQAMQ